MPHDPACNMAIDPELNDNYPFAELGSVYRLSIVESWDFGKTLDRILTLLGQYSALQAGKPLDKTEDKTPPKIAAVSPAVEINFDMYDEAMGFETHYEPDFDDGSFAE